MQQVFKGLLLTFALSPLVNFNSFAQDSIPEISPSPEVSNTLGQENVEEAKSVESEVEVLEPLDSWIKKAPLKHKEEENNQIEANEVGEKVYNEELIEEEKRVYEELVSSYVAPKERNEEIQRIFQKTILTKSEQARLEKMKATQKRVQAEVKTRLKKMNNVTSVIENTLRFCELSYDIMGLSTEVKSYKPEVSKFVNKLWKNSLNKIVSKSCDLVLISGIVARTSLKGQEFLDKTKLLISGISREDWSIKSGSSARGASYAVLFKSKILTLEHAVSIDKVSLRRGGIFEEEDFSINPSEYIFRDVRNGDKRFRLIANDFVYENAPLKKLKVPYQMQMASALKELAQNRAKSDPEVPVVLMLNMRFLPIHPAYHVLVGSLGLENFQPDGGCILEEVEEEVKEDVHAKEPKDEKVKKKKQIKEKKQVLKCDDSLVYQERILFNTFNDLYIPGTKTAKFMLKKIAKKKKNLTAGSFILQGDIGYVYSKDRNSDVRAGVSSLGDKELAVSLVWSDFYFKSE